MNRKWSLILLLSFFSLLLFACSNDKAEETVTSANGDTTSFSIAMRTFGLPYVENHPDINDDKYVKKLEEFTNTDLDFRLIPHAEYAEKMQLMLASDDRPDVMQSVFIDGPELAGGVEAGAFMPLNDLLEEHGQNLLEKIPQEAWDLVTYEGDGQIYAIPQYLSNTSRRGVAIRMDLLEKTGLDIPETTDEYLEVLRAFKELGVEHPFQGREKFHYADTFFGAFDAMPYQWEEHDGKVMPKFMVGDKIKKALEFYRTMYEEGLIHKEFLTIPQPEYRSNIISGKAGMWSMNVEEVSAWEKEIQQNVPEAEVAIIPAPKEPGGRGGHFYYDVVSRSFLINSETEVDPAKIIQFFDWQVSDEAHDFFTYGIEGDTYTVNENGEIEYEIKDDINFLNEQFYRTSWLWMIRDAVYTEGILELTEEGQQVMEYFDTILKNEGHGTIRFSGRPLEAFASNPEYNVEGVLAPEFWMTEAVKIIVGDKPVDYHDEIVELWLERGGEEAIEEATKRYNEDDGIVETGQLQLEK